jgi:hypothetical protein
VSLDLAAGTGKLAGAAGRRPGCRRRRAAGFAARGAGGAVRGSGLERRHVGARTGDAGADHAPRAPALRRAAVAGSRPCRRRVDRVAGDPGHDLSAGAAGAHRRPHRLHELDRRDARRRAGPGAQPYARDHRRGRHTGRATDPRGKKAHARRSRPAPARSAPTWPDRRAVRRCDHDWRSSSSHRASTTAGSNWVPAQRRSSVTA